MNKKISLFILSYVKCIYLVR